MMKVSLNFMGAGLHPSFVTETLNIEPNEQLEVGQEFTAQDSDESQISRVGKWTLTRLPHVSIGDVASSIGSWCEFLEERAVDIERITQGGFYGYLELKFDNSDEPISVDLGASELDLLARLGLELSVWKTSQKLDRHSPDGDEFEFVCPQPSHYLSPVDEQHFFEWLQSIDCVKSVRGVGSQLIVIIGALDKGSALEFAALMMRYGLDMRVLRPLCQADGGEWLGRLPRMFHSKIFVDSDDVL